MVWHNGWLIYQVIEQHMREHLRRWDYQEVNTPNFRS